MPSQPHKLLLYRHAVQHPLAEVAFLDRAAEHHRQPPPMLLREDFAGTSAVAAAFVQSHPDRQAVAVDHHSPTLRWADRNTRQPLMDRADDLHLVEADVLQFQGPRVEATLALNFSAFIFHTPDTMRRYFRHTRRCLRPGGVFVMDLFGGPGAMQPTRVSRTVVPDDPSLDPYDYVWEQRHYDPTTARIDCRLHFPGRDNAFRYDWRLWTPPELIDLLRDAGFEQPTLWSDDARAPAGQFVPDPDLAGRSDYLAYLTAIKA